MRRHRCVRLRSLPDVTSGRVRTAMYEEVAQLRVRRSLGSLSTRLLPGFVGNRLRGRLLRVAGVRVGAGTTFAGPVRIVGGEVVRFGGGCFVNGGLHVDVSAPVTVGDGVAIGQDVLILTNSHRIGPHEGRAGELTAAPVTIGDGVWLGARCVILPGVTVGAGSIVAAGSVVRADVAPDTLVAGVPARPKRTLPVDHRVERKGAASGG